MRDMESYQQWVIAKATYPNLGDNPLYPALGMAGECGEVCDKIKKVLRDKGGKFGSKVCREIASEIGDTLWYMAMLAYELGFTLDEIAEMNLKKCRSRLRRNKIHGEGDNR